MGTGELITSRRGFFWIGTERVRHGDDTVPRAPMFVAWEEPEHVTAEYPVVLVHGGGGQGTDWMGTPDGRPGWAGELVRRGHRVYVVDRPGHGRSPHHPDVLGPMGPPFGYERLKDLFAPDAAAERHIQWPGSRDLADPLFDQVAAPTGPMLADLAASQRLDAERLVQLLEQVGPAVLLTHSAGAPGGWLAADARPELVGALLALEPMGPPFLTVPDGPRLLPWGLTAAPPAFDPPVTDPAGIEPGTHRLPNLAKVPIGVFTGEASAFDGFGGDVVAFLAAAGCRAEHVRLAERGVRGNGHAVQFERNNREALAVLLGWLEEVTDR
ncbi:alpha/beta fold hydrolase [Pseudonocardia zijingensis]|uniref:Alpha/beta fold hydrolase n=1 Tax=Pseudonocardia zijingensis TaxID=153376 RepID=A0ABP3ZX41_9PSEU